MKNKINAISSLLLGAATACGAFAGFDPWVLAVMAVATGLLGLMAGFTGEDRKDD
ncbi:hypothetical protein LMG18897_0263 [Bifidobacterium adolescentis]|uniref:hypothetical protein n=1 Tax=Bifidobacterium adolescentis TaxID=1680 RepID=UPI000A259031|nr:hypothetical protein [Bifidobacterium adolescentis]OSH06163.1 hypothetical protein LMG18897_0263 [Bifidobacterium adolescentis]